MARCGCANQDCSCTVVGGTGIQVTGTGSIENPYRVENTLSSNFVVADTGSVDLSLTGSGTVDDPQVLSAVATLTIPSVAVQVFTSSGTWNRPTGKSIARATCVGGGGGGGSGRRGATSTVRTGGAGGGGGACARAEFFISDLPATVAVTVGSGGLRGAGITADSTNGQAGTNGSASSFGTYLVANGGFGGGGGSTSGGGGGGGGVGMHFGGPGANSMFTITVSDVTAPAVYEYGASGGGAGASINASNINGFPGPGGNNGTFSLGGGLAGTSPGLGGGGGQQYPLSLTVGGTGGGGGHILAAGGGGWTGGGGGGGGASTNGTTSGFGGPGGNGFVSIASW